MFKNLFKNLFNCNNHNSLTRKTRQSSLSNQTRQLGFETLEPRRLLAGIFFDAPSATVTIAGGSANDAGSFLQVDSTTYRAILSTAGQRDFSTSEVDRVIFIGFGGDDTFNNGSDVEGLLLGGSGDDTLRGGSQRDVINGGTGADELFGSGGMDRIVGGSGADRIEGGDGNDQIFGGDGANLIQGNEGDDFIFGGNDVDRIFGGNGIDSIFGLDGNDILSAGDGGVAGSAGIAQADFILGLGGDDRIIGGDGLNVLYGGNGNDTIDGGSGENRLHGQNGNDQLTGGSSNDFIAGNLGHDTLIGNAGNDFIIPGQGNDFVDAGLGQDFVVFGFDSSNYTLNASDTRLNSQHVVDGRDTVDNSETLRFSDGQQATSNSIQYRVFVQPIVVANSDGSNQAEFFGTEVQQAIIEAEIERIFSVAGVDIDFLDANFYNNTAANTGNISAGEIRSRADLRTLQPEGDAARVGSADPLVIDAYFVEVASGFGDVGEGIVNGLALIGAGGTTIHVGDDLLDSGPGLNTIATVTAHEIAHNLGLGHVDSETNLLGQGTGLTPEQISTIRASQFTQDCDTNCMCANCMQLS